MGDSKLGVVETHFAEIIWKNEPIGSRELAELCSKELNWKRPTTYNVLRKLCEKGIFQNNDGTVSSVLSREEFYGIRGEEFVDEAFMGSLPAFVAAFTSRKKLSDKEIDELLEIIRGKRG
ncbi:MAG: BlaI/MecI/CopY family transcriptional regulator [Acetatifactor sp.]